MNFANKFSLTFLTKLFHTLKYRKVKFFLHCLFLFIKRPLIDTVKDVTSMNTSHIYLIKIVSLCNSPLPGIFEVEVTT